NPQHLARSHDLLLAGDDEFERSFLYHRDLLVMMTVLGHLTAFGEIHSRHRNGFAVDHLARKSRTELLFLDLVPLVEVHSGAIVAEKNKLQPVIALASLPNCQNRDMEARSEFAK